MLGEPDSKENFKEGDSEWIYTVRVWPWNSILDVSVYKNHILMINQREDVGLLFHAEPVARTEGEANIVKKMLASIDKRDAVGLKR